MIRGLEGAIRVGGDAEGGFLAFPYFADIGLVHIHVQFHLGQVLGQGEEHRGGKGRGHGLSGLDAAGEDDTVDRRPDDRFGEVRLVGLERGLGLGDRRLGAGFIGLGPVEGRFCRIQLRLRGNLALAQFPDLLELASLARVSPTVAWACRTFALADSRAALDWVIWASSFEVSSLARTWPIFTLLL